ncbi:DUF1289 domain-containing protein [Undibacterium sp. LX40W]|uniref:DUF1289 domain-containing protein n=1 Tax=Undibacterium nitidum TaxID=2762298 RepID=A0A923HRQ5_9BURK|nr:MULTISPECIES: DUF1289 domain-containing protein [Undibacterium]MBC3883408.1 DUF1289 domain-containing protein [Undibacterium nitidum]MBC3893690.1 DUF1289 domain-containing protein [Undibacterium sp. LX40W]
MTQQKICPDTGLVLSPCTKVCKIDHLTKLCQGCWRSLDEIAMWSRATEPQKLAIWAKLEARKELT